ncbi:MAG: RNase adapter RapZ [Gammaproteobacteria bacterium]|nr:RNase adapter RapZ [Gammaproteobacteria bacterium]|tara:strand:- start:2428 stop:3291 length:864 start_codon:yes stop_codon:yes gene_type:complete
MHFLIVSGRSGAGKSSALGALEDLDFYCIDNLPVALLHETVSTLLSEAPGRNLAVSVDIRTLGHPTDVPSLVKSIAEQVNRLDVVFIDAVDETLAQRFSETRRLHPLSRGIERTHLTEAIQRESERLGAIQNIATCKIDSSGLSIHALRSQIRALVAGQTATRLMLKLQSFGFKHGVPTDSDTVFDARSLPNPHWEPLLRPLTGQDEPIQDYLNEFSETNDLLDEIEAHIRRWIPQHAASGRQYFTLSIGCTGGQHRSVFLAEVLSQRLNDLDLDRQVVHRDLPSNS